MASALIVVPLSSSFSVSCRPGAKPTHNHLLPSLNGGRERHREMALQLLIAVLSPYFLLSVTYHKETFLENLILYLM